MMARSPIAENASGPEERSPGHRDVLSVSADCAKAARRSLQSIAALTGAGKLKEAGR
jgi:hypothetical protein